VERILRYTREDTEESAVSSRGVRGLSKVMTPRAVKVRAAASSSESILYVWNNTNAMEISLAGFP